MTGLKRILTAMITLLLFSATAVLAAQPESTTKTDYTPFPDEQCYQGIPYLSGGVGVGEREELQEEMGRFNLKLIFALASGEYIADIPVKIKDQKGEIVLDVKSEGPWLYVSLPAGSYTINVSMDQIAKESMVTLEANKRKEVRFLW